MGKQSQLLLKPTEVELGLQVGVEFDKMVLDPLDLRFLDQNIFFSSSFLVLDPQVF